MSTQQINKRKCESDDSTNKRTRELDALTSFDWVLCPELEQFALELGDIDVAELILEFIEEEDNEKIRLINVINDKLMYLRNRKTTLVNELEQLDINQSEQYNFYLNSINKIEILCKYYTLLLDFKKIPNMSTSNLHKYINKFITKSPFMHNRITRNNGRDTYDSLHSILKKYNQQPLTTFYFYSNIDNGIIYTFSTNKYNKYIATNFVIECNKINNKYVIDVYAYKACFAQLFDVFYINDKFSLDLFENNETQKNVNSCIPEGSASVGAILNIINI